MAIKNSLRKIAVGVGLTALALGGCSTEKAPSRNDFACNNGYTFIGREGPAFLQDFNCDGKVDGIQEFSHGSPYNYAVMISASHKNDFMGQPLLEGVIVMTPEMQVIADSIYALEHRLAFLGDSIRYWGNLTGDTSNLTRSHSVRRR
ncbi:MAG: hypothetical protein NTW17_00225 [Candidatus Pacearchaeota archaeon]|nr:hypothetical protein [Candidatus Pacearchaeota archaeon]